MLSDHERKTLREVERQFMLEDPESARSFACDQRLPRDCHRPAAMMAGSLGGALACAITTGLIWATWRHSRDNSPGAT